MLFNFFTASLLAGFAFVAHAAVELRSQNDTRAFDQDEIHINVLRSWPSDRLIHSRDLENYTTTHSEAVGSTVYLLDRKSFVTITEDYDTTLRRRESCGNAAPERKVLKSQTFWDPWIPISNCVKSGKDESGGYVTFEFSVTKGSSTDIGLALGPFKDIVGAAVGISLSTDYTYGSTYACNVPGGGVGQVWGRHWMAWAEIQQINCNYCTGCITKIGYALMPQNDFKNGEEPGCSAGDENVICPPNPPL